MNFEALKKAREQSIARENLGQTREVYSPNIVQLSDATGLSKSAVSYDTGAVQKRYDADNIDLDKIATDAPTVFRNLQQQQDAETLGLSLEKMTALESSLNKLSEPQDNWVKRQHDAIGNAFDIAKYRNLQTDLSLKSMMGKTTDLEEDLLNAYYEMIQEKSSKDYQLGNWLDAIPALLADQIPMYGKLAYDSAKYIAGGAAIGGLHGSSAGPAGALAGGAVGGIWGGRIGMTGGAMGFETANAFEDFRRMKDTGGNLIDRDIAIGAAAISGIAAGGVEAFGLGKLLSTIPGSGKLFSTLSKQGVKKAMKSPAFRQALSTYGKTVAKHGGIEGATEGLQEAIQILMGIAAGEVAEGTFEKPTLEESAARVAESARAGLLVGGTITSVTAGVTLKQEHAKIELAKERGEAFRALADSAKDNEVLKQAPKKYKDYLQQMREQLGDGDRVYVDPDTLKTYFQEANIPEETVKELMPDLYKQMTDPLQASSDLFITLDDLAQHFAPLDSFGDLYGDLKVNPDELSVNEAIKYEEELNNVMSQYEEQANIEDSAAETDLPVMEAVKQQLVNTGVSISDAEKQGALWQARYNTRAANLGVDAFQLFRTENISIAKEGLHPAQDLDRRSAIYDRIRNGDIPSTKEQVGHTLAEFLASVGGLTPDADLLSRDYDKIKLDGRKLLSNGGLDIDTAIEQAKEAGFIPDTFTPNEFMQELENSLGDNPSYSPSQQAQGAIQLAQEIEDTILMLDAMGLDLTELTNEQVNDYIDSSGYNQGPNGYIVTNENKDFMQITLSGKANASTFLHESGHAFLFQLLKDAKHKNATPAMKKQAAGVRDWWMRNSASIATEASTKETAVTEKDVVDFITDSFVGSLGKADLIDTALNEQWARGFEAYLFEGKAPTELLRSIFNNFKVWMKYVYKSLAKLNVDIDPEITHIMEQLFATDKELTEARSKTAVSPVFPEHDTKYMTDAQYTDYMKLNAERMEQAGDKLDLLQMRYNAKKRSKEVSDARKKIKEQVTLEVMARLDVRTRHLLMKGTYPNSDTPVHLQGAKLSKQGVLDVYPSSEILKDLRQTYKKEGGEHPDTIAPLLGYKSGMDLINSLKDKVNWANEINTKVDTIINEQFPDPRNNGELAQKAKEALHSDKTAKFILMELDVLNGSPTSPLKVIKEAARKSIRTINYGNIRPDRFMSAELKYARLSAKALAEGDRIQATSLKMKQLLNHQMYIEGIKIKKQFDASVKRMGRLSGKTYQARMGKAGQEYRVAVNKILESVDLRSISNIKATRREIVREANLAIANINQAKKSEIDLIVLPPKSYKAMDIDEFMEYANKAEELYHEASTLHTIILNGEKLNFDDVKNSLISGIEENHDTSQKVIDLWSKVTDKPLEWLKAVDAYHAKLEFVLKQLDGNTEGVWWKTFMPQLQKADNMRDQMLEEYGAKINDALMPIAKTLNDKILIKGINKKTTRSSALMMALNLGNQGNKTKMYEGMEQYGWDKEAIDSATDQLTKQEWQAVQDVLDVVNSLWPAIAELEERRTGYAPEKVEAIDIHTPYGVLPGGYFPLAYDPKHEISVQENDDRQKLREQGGNLGVSASTRQGHNKARIDGVKKAILFDLSVINKHITQVIQDLALDEPTRNLNKIIKDKAIQEKMIKAVGMNKYKLFNQWLVDNARGDYSTSNFDEKIAGPLNALRANTTMMSMGYKISTMLVQPLGISQSVQMLGPGVVTEMTRYAANPARMIRIRREVLTKSTMMKFRVKNIDRDIRDAINAMLLESKGKVLSAHAKAKMMAFRGIIEMDLMVSVPTWNYAYKESKKMGATEQEAIDFADGKVRQTQGHGSIKDLSQVQRSNSFMRLATMFYMYFNSYYNMLGEAARVTKNKWTEGNKDTAILYAFKSYILLTGIPAVLGEAVLGRGPEEDEDWLTWAGIQMISYPAYAVIGLRDIMNHIVTGYDYKMSPVQGSASKIMSGAEDLTQGEFKKSGYLAVGLLTGSPVFSAQGWILLNNVMAAYDGEKLEADELIMLKEHK